jgi:hypothetical protein
MLEKPEGSWVLLKRVDHNEVVLVTEHVHALSGGVKLYNWTELARGSDADYNILLKMAELTGHYVELQVNRNRRHIDELTSG